MAAELDELKREALDEATDKLSLAEVDVTTEVYAILAALYARGKIDGYEALRLALIQE